MSLFSYRFIAQSLLSSLKINSSIFYEDRIPSDIPVIVISNHRSFLDAPILINAFSSPLRIACHHYMGQTPVIRDLVNSLGCFPLGEAKGRQQKFFEQADSLLASRQWVGLFPEGTPPMIEPTKPQEVGRFQKGFAHLAWRVSVNNLAVLPVAIASLEETIYPTVPIRWLRQFDATEPLFSRSGLHPMIVYHRVNLLIGRPYWINNTQKQRYKGKQAKILTQNLTDYCQQQIQDLLNQGCY